MKKDKDCQVRQLTMPSAYPEHAGVIEDVLLLHLLVLLFVLIILVRHSQSEKSCFKTDKMIIMAILTRGATPSLPSPSKVVKTDSTLSSILALTV